MKGFLLVIADGTAKLVFTGYSGEEGHKRSHALRVGLAAEGAEVEMQTPTHEPATTKDTVSA